MNKLFFALVVAMLNPLAAHSASLIGLKFKDDVTVDGKKLVLNGLGLRKADVALGLRVDVYVGALYLEKPSTDAAAIIASAEPKLVRIAYARDVSKDKSRQTWQENFDKLCATDCAKAKPGLDAWLGFLEDMKEDEFQEYVFTSAGVKVSSKGKEKGLVANPEFAKIALRVWLESPPNPELRDGMLGLAK